MTIPKLTPYTGQVANPDGSQTQTEFTQNMFGQLSYEAQLATELDATIDGMNQAVTDVENSAAEASASATSAEAAASTAGYQGLWPDIGGSANKGETWQTQVGGVPTGEYYTALQNTSVDPVGDNVNWKAQTTKNYIDTKNQEQDGLISENSSAIEANANAITSLDSRVTINESAISAASQDITTLNSRVTTNESDIAALQSGQGSSVYGYATLADMNADLTPDDQSIGYVTNDVTATNNGTYRKSGATGTGSWIQSSSDLASQAYAQAIYNSNRVYTAFDAINNVRVDGNATLDEQTKISIISSGTPDTETILYRVQFDDVIELINSAISNGVYDFEVSVEVELTSAASLTLVKISNLETTQDVQAIQPDEQLVIPISFSSGEELIQFYFYTRYSGTAPSNLITRIKVAQIKSENDAVNAQLKQAYDRVVIAGASFIEDVLINENQYQVSHKADIATTGLEQTYRGVKIAGGSSIPANKTYIGFYLPKTWKYLDGKDFDVVHVIRVTGELTASELYSGIWADIGGGLYSRTVSYTNFDSNNSSDIFKFQWNKAVSPANDIVVDFIELTVRIAGDENVSLVKDRQSDTKFDNTLIYATTASNNGTYGHEYVNLLTAMHSLTDGSESKQYDIILTGGEFDIAAMLDYDDIQDQVPYKRGLELSPWVNMIGKHDTQINCKFTEAFAVANQDIAKAVSPLNFLGNNKLRNITSYAENCRYVVHDDGNTVDDGFVDTECCHFEHLGNAPTVTWKSTQAYGSGFRSGKIGTFKNTEFISVTDALTIHTSQAQKRPFIARFFGCGLVSKGEGASLGMKETTAYNPKMVNTFELHGCTLGGKITSENKNNPDSFNLVGGGNTVVPVETVDGVRQVNLLGDQGVKKVLTEAASALALLAHSGSGKVRLFTPSDNVKLFAGFAQEAGSTGDLIAVQDGGYIADSDMGITLVVGDTVAIDSGVIVKNGTNTIAICDYDGFAKLI